MLEDSSCRVILPVVAFILQELSMILEQCVVQLQDGALHQDGALGRDQF